MRDGREKLFEELKPIVDGGEPDGALSREMAARLGTSEGAVKVAVHEGCGSGTGRCCGRRSRRQWQVRARWRMN